MPLAAPNVLLVTGRLAQWGEAWRLGQLRTRLAEQHLEVAVLCVANGGVLCEGHGLVECAGLGSRWKQPWALRRLQRGSKCALPHLLHVLQGEMTRVGIRLADRWRIPYIQTIEDFLPPGGRLPVSRRWCRGLVVPCQELADDLIRNLGVPEPLVCVVPPAVPVDLGKSKRSEHVQVPVIGAAGRFVEGSGLAVFLRAARGVVDAGIDAEFVVAGRGPSEAELRRGAEQLRIADRVTFADEPTADGPFWNVLDLFCLTSLVPTVGRTFTIALAHGVPTVVSDVEGLRSRVADHSTGLLVPPGDADALTGAMIALLGDLGRVRQLTQRARGQVAEAFHPAREADLLANLYLSIIAPAEPARGNGSEELSRYRNR
jgi:glycosyltransferase involved in cell wall biosynthesis